MPDPSVEPIFYWVPGCANCTRLKAYLSDRGVAYRSVNIQGDPIALDALRVAGHRALPVLRVGDQWITGDERTFAAALGLAPGTRRIAPPPPVLVARGARMLDLSSALAMQIPPAHFDDPTPTMVDFVASGRRLADGTPFVPHGTTKSLVHHIAQHGEKTRRLLLASDGVYELGFAIDGSGDYSFFGEPEPATPMYRIAASLRLMASDLRSWLRTERPAADMLRMLDTHRGPKSMAQYLEIQIVGLLQHTRQLAAAIEALSLKPAGEVAEGDLEGLAMPRGLWD